MLHRAAISIVVAYILGAIAWDGLMAALGVEHESFCQACADVNAWSKGLFALSIPGLYLHMFFQWILPRSWKG